MPKTHKYKSGQILATRCGNKRTFPGLNAWLAVLRHPNVSKVLTHPNTRAMRRVPADVAPIADGRIATLWDPALELAAPARLSMHGALSVSQRRLVRWQASFDLEKGIYRYSDGESFASECFLHVLNPARLDGFTAMIRIPVWCSVAYSGHVCESWFDLTDRPQVTLAMVADVLEFLYEHREFSIGFKRERGLPSIV